MQHREVKPTSKAGLNSDWSLQLDSMKSELLVIANQPCRGEYVPGSCHVAVNTFPGLVHTARQTMRAGNTRSRYLNPQGRETSKVGLVIGVKSKQGIPTGTWGWITSFLWRKMDVKIIQ